LKIQLNSGRNASLCWIVAILLIIATLGAWPSPASMQGPAQGELKAFPICGTPHFHDDAVYAGQHYVWRPLSKKELRASGELDAEGNLTPDTVGQQRTFWAYNFVTREDYQVTATCKKVGAHSYIYVEDGKTVADTTLTSIMNEFDNNVYTTDTNVFGSEPNPGIDGDSHIYILLLDIKDGWNGITVTSYIAGYFDATNEYPASVYSHSNEKEMFYMDIHPATPGSTEFYGTLAHEFQHMIHWWQDAEHDEETWVNEGCSDLAQFVCGYGHPASHLYSGSSTNPGFLESPDHQLTLDWPFWTGKMADYGAAYVWALYVWEHYGGNPIITAMVADDANGIAGINNALAGQGYSDRFPDAFSKWTVANYLDDGTGAYGYASLTLLDSGYDNENTFQRPVLADSHSSYPLGDTSATVNYWAADTYNFIGGDGRNLVLNFNGADDNVFGVNVVRSTSSKFAAGTNTVDSMVLDPSQDGSFAVPNFGTTNRAALLIPSGHSTSGGKGYSYNAVLTGELTPTPTPTPTATPTLPGFKIYLPLLLKNYAPSAPTPTPTPTITPTLEPTSAGARGRILWNDEGASGAYSRLCQDYNCILGTCSGRQYNTTTDTNGWYEHTDVVPDSYCQLVRSADEPVWWYRSLIFGCKEITIKAGEITITDDYHLFKTDLVLLSPPDDSTLDTNQPTLIWAAYPSAAYYKVYLRRTSPSSETILHWVRVDGTSITVPDPLSGGKYRWGVNAYNANGRWIAESRYYYFTVPGPPGSNSDAYTSPHAASRHGRLRHQQHRVHPLLGLQLYPPGRRGL